MFMDRVLLENFSLFQEPAGSAVGAVNAAGGGKQHREDLIFGVDQGVVAVGVSR